MILRLSIEMGLKKGVVINSYGLKRAKKISAKKGGEISSGNKDSTTENGKSHSTFTSSYFIN
jgi:hypothetical protein